MLFNYISFYPNIFHSQVIEGMSVLKILEEQETNNERPKKACVVADCGLFDVEKLYT